MAEISNQRPEPFSFCTTPFIAGKIIPPSQFVSLPEGFPTLVGQIAMTWGAFERSFDDLLVALFKANKTIPPKNWKTQGHKKRAEFLERESKKFFYQNSQIHEYIMSIISDSYNLNQDRNILIHGNVSIKIQTGPVIDGRIQGIVHLVMQSIVNKQLVIKQYTLDDVESIFYNIAHLLGKLDVLTKNNPMYLKLSSSDKSFLQDFLDKNYKKSPNPVV